MLLRTLHDERLAQLSYLIGCQDTGTAIVIDPARDILPYLQIAQDEGLEIVLVAETHIHADYVSGSRELAHITGATIVLSGEGTSDWQYAFPSEDALRIVHHGDQITIGNIVLEVLHTPGHTPEHICLLITDGKIAHQPMGILTGDCLFVGSVGRPDLLDKVANAHNTSLDGARQQFANLQLLGKLPDYLQVLPGHGAGSACGKSLGAVLSSTIGYEKLTNPAFGFNDADAFAGWLLSDQPEPPTYFAHLKQVNRVGARLLKELPQPQHIAQQPDSDIIPADALFVDTRPAHDYASHMTPGTVNIPISAKNFCTFVGWYVRYDAAVFFVAYQNDVQEVMRALLAIGIDDVPGYFTAEVAMRSPQTLRSIEPEDAFNRSLAILDVRNADEVALVRIAGAVNIPLGIVPDHLAELPTEQPFGVICSSGVRSQIVTSLLLARGFTNAINISGGMKAWQAAGLPVDD